MGRTRNPDGTCPVCQPKPGPNRPSNPSTWVCDDCADEFGAWLQRVEPVVDNMALAVEPNGNARVIQAARKQAS